jgi:hypothetical protein
MFAGAAGCAGMAGVIAGGSPDALEANGVGGLGRGDASPQPARLMPSTHAIAQDVCMQLR